MRLRPCPSCARHVAADAIACPFCAARLPPAPAPRVTLVAGRLSRAAVFAGVSACWTSSSTPAKQPPPPPPADAAVAVEPPPPTGAQSITGRVVEAGTRSPLANVTVDLRDEHGRVAVTNTDEVGRYAFDHIAPGSYELVFRYGTGMAVGTAQQPVSVGDRPAQVDIALEVLHRAPTPKPYGAPPARRRTV